MQRLVFLFVKIVKRVKRACYQPVDWLGSFVIFYVNNVQFSSFSNQGWPRVNVSREGGLTIGPGFRSNNREMANPIGRFHPCSLIVSGNGKLSIGSNVGMSSSAIVGHREVVIGDNVNLGGGTVIYDTDFHSIKRVDRIDPIADRANTKTAPVIIEKDVFIGGHTTILKGVTIGEGSVIGACSVVTRNIPAGELWAGNPAKFLRSLSEG